MTKLVHPEDVIGKKKGSWTPPYCFILANIFPWG